MDLHSRFLCNIALYSIELYFHHQSYPQLGVVLLWLHLFILSGVISPLISSSILYICQAGEFIFQCLIFLPFHIVHGVLKARMLSGLPLHSPLHHVLSELSNMTCLSWVSLQSMAYNTIKFIYILCLFHNTGT